MESSIIKNLREQRDTFKKELLDGYKPALKNLILYLQKTGMLDKRLSTDTIINIYLKDRGRK